ncbi:predicted protein [Uncinocarpus reesii 1704]|uniref:Zn(2)-C6 fungal-type domain-containing protein n=1 Tax=Uncinocarpus reesii (strain UAMH 1704) TaxID=336963 RepID=C4JMT3_UNCRE|nr:uncharacterized protein UREG_04141 [Uncinocarpus reesii 1704]EEP79295.1 predicted protein [Uncinocarpus reesii 1704]
MVPTEISSRDSTSSSSPEECRSDWEVGGAELPVQRPRTRRPHNKTRSGCVCDEKKPECQRCQLHGVACLYNSAEELFGEDRSLKRLLQGQRPTKHNFSLSLTSNESSIDHVLQSAGDVSSVSRENLEAVRRFEVFTSHTVGAPIARYVARTYCIPLAYKTPHLMHAMIACSITHLQHVVPSYRPRAPAEYHWNRAISLFTEQLNGPIDSSNIDAIISTCMLLAIHSFTSSNDTSSGATWVFSPPDTAANWLYVAGGLHAVLGKSGAHGQRTIWDPVFEHSENYFNNSTFDIQDIPPAFRELCDIDKSTDSSNNPYYTPLRTLFILMRLEPSGANFAKLVIFVGQMLSGYRDLVQGRDHRALLILAYWFGLMCGVDQWWIQDRVRSECRAICKYLERSAADPRIIQLLDFPALACGYVLNTPFT